MMKAVGKPSSHSIECHGTCYVVQFSPFELSSSLLAIGSDIRVSVGVCKFQDDDASVDGVNYENLRDFHHGTQVVTIAWSPETSLAVIPRIVRFCTAGRDKKLRIYTSDLRNDDKVQIVDGHTDYINAVCFDPEKGEHIASVSDDLTCRIWDTEGVQRACLSLGSPGMDVAWHHEDSMKIMVAEKKGIIRFYNLLTQQPIMSLDTGHIPLMSADWCHGNPLQVGAVAGTDCLIFDTSRSSRPVESKQSHPEGTRFFRWCKSHKQLVATAGRSGTFIKVFNTKTDQTLLSSSIPISYGISWHYKLPIIAVGGDRKVHFWVVDSI